MGQQEETAFYKTLFYAGIVTSTTGDPRTSVLTIAALASSDAGDYTCLAIYTGLGTVTSAAKTVIVFCKCFGWGYRMWHGPGRK